jgi:hypothetical protein
VSCLDSSPHHFASFFIERGRHDEARPDDIGLEDISLRLERIERKLEELGSERRETGSRGQNLGWSRPRISRGRPLRGYALPRLFRLQRMSELPLAHEDDE